jgi:lysozyme family protein
MASENKDKGLDELFKLEGYKSDLPGDSGGSTIWGITSRWFPETVEKINALIANGQSDMAFAMAKDFYIQNFWVPTGCNALSYPLDCMAFCQAANMGVVTIKNLIAVNNTPETFIQACRDKYKVIEAAHPEDVAFDRGWSNRLDSIVEAFV